jgi:hypothetical protein
MHNASLKVRKSKKNVACAARGRPNAYVWDWAYSDVVTFLILCALGKKERSQKYMFRGIPLLIRSGTNSRSARRTLGESFE